MELRPKYGIDRLLFGMKQENVRALYGEPDKIFKDDEDNIILVYHEAQLRLTFYQDELHRLGYIICANPKVTIGGEFLVGKKITEVKKSLEKLQITKWETEEFDITENHFNEDNWLILQTEFGQVIKIEIGAIINDADEFEWRFK
jgi:hypothetical protein